MRGRDKMDIIMKNIIVSKRRSRPYAQCPEGETKAQRGAGCGPDHRPKHVRGGTLAQRVPVAASTAPARLRMGAIGQGQGLDTARPRLRRPEGGGRCGAGEGLPALPTA